MSDSKKKIIISIVIKIVLLLVIIFANYILSKPFGNDSREALQVEVIDETDESIAIVVSSAFSMKNIALYTLTAFIVINIFILLIFDFASLNANKTPDKKYLIKTVLAINLIIIFASLLEVAFFLLFPSFIMVMNIVVLSIAFIIIYFLKSRAR